MAGFQFGKYRIENDQTIYFVAYTGGRRELIKRDQDAYDKALRLPEEAQQAELIRLGPTKNPNIIPIEGRVLLEYIRNFKLTPMFDSFFEQSHKLQINNSMVIEAMRQKSYDVLRGV